jgi:hypothetical protein
VEKMRIRRPSALLLIRVIVQIAMTKIPLFYQFRLFMLKMDCAIRSRTGFSISMVGAPQTDDAVVICRKAARFTVLETSHSTSA